MKEKEKKRESWSNSLNSLSYNEHDWFSFAALSQEPTQLALFYPTDSLSQYDGASGYQSFESNNNIDDDFHSEQNEDGARGGSLFWGDNQSSQSGDDGSGNGSDGGDENVCRKKSKRKKARRRQSSSNESWSPTIWLNGSGENGNNYSRKFRELKHKQSITEPVKYFREGDDVRAWLGYIELMINYYEFSNESARMFIYNHVDSSTIKNYVANIMKEYRGCSIPDLMTALYIGLGGKSRSIVIAESKKMKRKNGETVQRFGLRVDDVIHQKAMADPKGKMLIDTEYVKSDALDIFYKGLRSQKFVRECLEREVKTIQEATIVIANYVAREIRLSDYSANCDNIPFKADCDLYLKPHGGKFFANSLFSIGELDMDGNEAIANLAVVNDTEPQDGNESIADLAVVNAIKLKAKPLVTKQSKITAKPCNVMMQKEVTCLKCGQVRNQAKHDCPAKSQKCHKCKKKDHFASMCNRTVKPAIQHRPQAAGLKSNDKLSKMKIRLNANAVQLSDNECEIKDVLDAMRSIKQKRKDSVRRENDENAFF